MKFTKIEPQESLPMPETGIIRRVVRAGRYCATFTIDLAAAKDVKGVVGQLNVAWEPDVPHNVPMNERKRFISEYVRGRNALFQEAANILGGSILVADC